MMQKKDYTTSDNLRALLAEGIEECRGGNRQRGRDIMNGMQRGMSLRSLELREKIFQSRQSPKKRKSK